MKKEKVEIQQILKELDGETREVEQPLWHRFTQLDRRLLGSEFQRYVTQLPGDHLAVYTIQNKRGLLRKKDNPELKDILVVTDFDGSPESEVTVLKRYNLQTAEISHTLGKIGAGIGAADGSYYAVDMYQILTAANQPLYEALSGFVTLVPLAAAGVGAISKAGGILVDVVAESTQDLLNRSNDGYPQSDTRFDTLINATDYLENLSPNLDSDETVLSLSGVDFFIGEEILPYESVPETVDDLFERVGSFNRSVKLATN